MTMESEDSSKNKHYRAPTGHEAEHIIRVVGPNRMICDIAMSDKQLKETLYFIRTLKDDEVRLSFNDAVLELLRTGAVRVVRRYQ